MMFRIISTKKLMEIEADASRRVDKHMKTADAALAVKREAEEALAAFKAKPTLYCSFCGKSQHDVKKLIAGSTVFICDECVEVSMNIILEANIKVRAAK